jgi:hypothetical protein
MVYPRIAVYEQVAKRDDPLKIGNLSCKRRLRLGQKVQCLANDLKFSLNRRMVSGDAAYPSKSTGAIKADMASAASRTSNRKLRGSRGIDEFARAINASQHIGIVDCPKLDKVHLAVKQR